MYHRQAPGRRLSHHGSKGSMSVALLLKFQSVPRCSFTVRKIDEHTKHRLLVRLARNLFVTIHSW